MTPSEFNHTVLTPGLAFLRQHVPSMPLGRDVQVLMLAIAGQESNWSARVQGGGGPAHGFWQYERAGGVRGVLTHPATKLLIGDICIILKLKPLEWPVWTQMAKPEGDTLSVCMARLLLWTDPAPIPACEDYDATWDYYERNWRPGKPRRDAWDAILEASVAAIDKAGAVA